MKEVAKSLLSAYLYFYLEGWYVYLFILESLSACAVANCYQSAAHLASEPFMDK